MKRDKVVPAVNAPKGGDVIDAGRRAAAAAIRDARRRAGLTQEQAAATLGHATSTISRWETGGLPHNWEQLTAYAHALGQAIVLRFGPDATKEPPPEWAGAMEQRIVSEVVANREALYAALAQRLVEIALGQTQPPDEPPDETTDRPTAGAGPRPAPRA